MERRVCPQHSGRAPPRNPRAILTAVLGVEGVLDRPWVSALKDGIHFGIQRLFWGYRDTREHPKRAGHMRWA